MRYELLRLLREKGDRVSGEALSRELGVSRVSVWKSVRELSAAGYDISATSRGYFLVSSPDVLLPGEFPGWEDRVHHLDEVDSTMIVARDLARKGAVHGTLVTAERQTGGRGRLERSWFSPKGGIYMTLVTRPSVAAGMAPRINLLSAVAVASAVESLHGISARVKWPNDVLVDGKKLCGILAEMEAEMDAVRFVNIGVGLNANVQITDAFPDAVSLSQLLGHDVNRRLLAREVVEGILRRLQCVQSADILDEWRCYAHTLGRRVSIATGNTAVEGLAIDIDDFGALLVKRDDGTLMTVVAGDCTHRTD